MWDNDIARVNMIKQQIHTADVFDERILELILQVPREDFVPSAFKKVAFADTQIPLAHHQVMMTPMIEAKIIQALAIAPHEKVLEVGTGTGYLTALLSLAGQHVYSVDIFPEFTLAASEKLHHYGFKNVTLQTGYAAFGWEPQQPYDIICLTGAIPAIPTPLKQQLKIGGRLFVIVGTAPAMEALLVTRLGESSWQEEKLFETEITPLVLFEQPKHFVF